MPTPIQTSFDISLCSALTAERSKDRELVNTKPAGLEWSAPVTIIVEINVDVAMKCDVDKIKPVVPRCSVGVTIAVLTKGEVSMKCEVDKIKPVVMKYSVGVTLAALTKGDVSVLINRDVDQRRPNETTGMNI
jgi:hypothetical protein